MAPLALTWEAAAFTAVVTLAAYLIGSIPTAYLVVRRRRGQDIRRLGDGNAGAENVARVLGRKAGIIVALIDLSKGLVVILLVRGLAALVGGDFPFSPAGPDIQALPANDFPALEGCRLAAAMLAGAAAVIGHGWPVYLRGPGGRGAATAAGVMLGMAPISAWPVVIPALGAMYLTRSTTVGAGLFFIGAIALATAFSYYHLFAYTYPLAAYAVALPTLVGIIHCISLRRRPTASA